MPIKKSSRHGRYRKLLLAPESLAPIAAPLAAVFDVLDQKRLQGILSDAEFVSYGLLTLLACRRADAFQNHQSRNSASANLESSAPEFCLADLWMLLSAHKLPVSSYQKILDQKISIYDFLVQIRFRGIRDSAHMALLKWLDNEYPLTLLFHIPSATEVFELQKQGGRCISFLKQAAELTELHHGRDAMSFIIHDLIHAHEFYANPLRAQQQIGFYHWLDNIKSNPQLLGLQADSAGFLERWEYVLSDMNSYCGHLLKTLNAAFAFHDNTADGVSLWASIVDASDLETAGKTLFRKINSPEWGDEDFLQLESLLEKRFKTATSAEYIRSTY